MKTSIGQARDTRSSRQKAPRYSEAQVAQGSYDRNHGKEAVEISELEVIISIIMIKKIAPLYRRNAEHQTRGGYLDSLTRLRSQRSWFQSQAINLVERV